MSEPVVRVSQGFFAPHLAQNVADKLVEGRATLDPALRPLRGLLHYYVAIDTVSNSMVNISVWENLEAASQMDSLKEMLAQRDVFIIPCENSIVSIVNGQARVSREAGLYFSGNRDNATLLRSSSRKTTFIAIEFSPQGAYPIFGIPMTETVNRLCETDLLLTRWSRPVREALNGRHDVREKVSVIQEQLIHLLRTNDRRNAIVDYCVQSLRATNGLMPIGKLAQRTGYSRRYLDLLFRQHVGLAPKVLAGIFRFQKFYRKWAEGQSFDVLKDGLYEYYSDQSHFTKEFRRMTGHSPRQFSMQVSNEFGRRLTLR